MSNTVQQTGQILTLTSPSQKSLRPLIESAIQNELRLIHAGIQNTQQRITEFETHYEMTTEEFLRRYRNGDIADSLEMIEWFGEWKMLKEMREDEDSLREVRFAD